MIDATDIPITAGGSPAEVAWEDHGVDLVLECSGEFRTIEALAPYFEHAVRKVVVAAPVKDDRAVNIVVGVNDDRYDADRHDIVTAASCTTNCLAPLVKVLHEGLGIERGSITTLHDVTNTQVVVDAPHKDLRRARAASLSLIPTTTGSATAIGLIFPELQDIRTEFRACQSYDTSDATFLVGDGSWALARDRVDRRGLRGSGGRHNAGAREAAYGYWRAPASGRLQRERAGRGGGD